MSENRTIMFRKQIEVKLFHAHYLKCRKYETTDVDLVMVMVMATIMAKDRDNENNLRDCQEVTKQ